MSLRHLSAALLVLAVSFVGAAGCRSLTPPNGPAQVCRARCEQHTKNVCTASECVRGCELSMDRVVENEVHNVIACVSKSTRGCTDTVWAECNALIGPNADGGPPPPEDPIFDDED